MAKKQPKKHFPLRTRTTRSKGKVLSDPIQNTRQLTEQLRSLGLYPADTVGDGNCLFRALSDQLYGTPSHHPQLRKNICDWIEDHPQRYEPFCEDERGLGTHLQCMREHGTYGGHLELSAFAHHHRRNVKVVQPGLVYVIEWDAGDPSNDDEGASHENRRSSRMKHRDNEPSEPPSVTLETGPSLSTIYVAYHDWEHFSSIRNLNGPHTGLPNVREVPIGSEVESRPPPKKLSSRIKSKPETKSSKTRSLRDQSTVTETKIDDVLPSTPSQVPLPLSRSPSPCVNLTSSTLNTDTLNINFRIPRSPKRSIDESSGSSASEGIAKRTRSSRTATSRTQLAVEADDTSMEASTPGLSGSSTGSTRSSSVSSSPLPSTPPAYISPPPEPEKSLTRRQRKALGLPKPRPALMARKVSAGKIIIPGGRYKKGTTTKAPPSPVQDEDREDEEWRRNGTGRVDVRGFRELKI